MWNEFLTDVAEEIKKEQFFLFFVITKTNKNRFNNNFLFFVRNNEIFFIISQYRANVRIDTGFVSSFNGFDFENLIYGISFAFFKNVHVSTLDRHFLLKYYNILPPFILQWEVSKPYKVSSAS